MFPTAVKEYMKFHTIIHIFLILPFAEANKIKLIIFFPRLFPLIKFFFYSLYVYTFLTSNKHTSVIVEVKFPSINYIIQLFHTHTHSLSPSLNFLYCHFSNFLCLFPIFVSHSNEIQKKSSKHHKQLKYELEGAKRQIKCLHTSVK